MGGWQFDGLSSWLDDDTLNVIGTMLHHITDQIFFTLSDSIYLFYLILIFVEGKPTYPEKVTILSTGETSETWPSVLGVYIKTNMTHSDRPVWQSTDRDDRYLFYKGIERVFFSLPF